MCTRIIQYRPGEDYVAALECPDVAPATILDPQAPGYNLAPGARLRVIRHLDGELVMGWARWGHVPSSAGRKSEPLTRARVQDAASSKALADLWRRGRCIVPADGWYEWQGEGVRAQPFRIRLPQNAPLFLAAVADLDADGDEAGELIIVTAQLGFGLLDSDDQRPVVLTAEDACTWLDPATSDDAACKLAQELLLPAPAFQWYPVTPAVHNPHFDRAQALDEVTIPA
jgi:putative SOS response-associated peptidase YedK